MNCCGVYIFMLAGAPVYIGKAVNMARRVGQHSFPHDDIQFLPMSEAQAVIEERRLIKEHKPKFNTQWTKYDLPTDRAPQPNDYPRINFRVSVEAWDRLQRIEERTGLKMSQVLNACLSNYLPVIEAQHGLTHPQLTPRLTASTQGTMTP